MTAKDKTYLVKWIVPRPNPMEFEMRCAGMNDRKDFEARMSRELGENGSEEIFEILHEFLGVTPILEFHVVSEYTSDWEIPASGLEFEFNIHFRGKHYEKCLVTPPIPFPEYEVTTLSYEFYCENTVKEWTKRVKEYIFGISGHEFKVGKRTTAIPDFRSPAELRMKLQLAAGRTKKDMTGQHPPLDPRPFTDEQLEIISLLESLGVVFRFHDSRYRPHVSLEDRSGIAMVMHFTNGRKYNTSFHSIHGKCFQDCMKVFMEHLGSQTPPWTNIELCEDTYVTDFHLPPYSSIKELKMKLQLRKASETT